MRSFTVAAAFLTWASIIPALPLSSQQDSYDFVIVGGGTAGLALATRLSQRLPEDKVLVIEAGPSALNEPRINIPGRKGSTLGTVYDWNFTTVPQTNLNERVVSIPRGKVLGGTSALNLICWDRPSSIEYDTWVDLGNPGWDWNSTLDYMLKVENFTDGTETQYRTEGVGFGGPIGTLINRYVPTQQSYYTPTLERLGLPYNVNPLAGQPLGVSDQTTNLNQSYVRQYSANSYLPLAGTNLEVMDQTLADRIEMSRASDGRLKATGVVLASGVCIKATKEVILAAGSIQSPGFLERSGIGQSAALEKLGIAVLENLPGVGENMQHHQRVSNSFQLRENYTSFDKTKVDQAYAQAQLALYNESQVSAYDYSARAYLFVNWEQAYGQEVAQNLIRLAEEAVSNTSDVGQRAVLDWLKTDVGQGVPQLEVLFSDGYTGFKGYPAANSLLYGQGFSTLITGFMHEFSRGSIHINSTDPSVQPLIDPRHLSNEYEIQALINAVKFHRKIASTWPLSQAFEAEYEPGPEVVTDEQIREYVIGTVLTFYHPVGTNAMLPRESGGVVSPELVVYGTSNLRICDASIFPLLVSAHPQTSVYAVAERLADILVSKWA